MQYVVEPGMGATFALGVDAYNWRFMAEHIREGMTVYDVGANRGQMALLYSRLVGPTGRVMSFEPMPQLCRSLERNLSLNRIANVEARCAAVAERGGRKTFRFTEAMSTQGKLADVEPTYQIDGARDVEVDAVTLDEIVDAGHRPPDFLKIDVEGGARSVLLGARRVLESARPTIYIELHGPEEQEAVRDCLMSIGYQVARLSGEPVADPTLRWESPLHCYQPART
jgi:FkbM family methyltransferase